MSDAMTSSQKYCLRWNNHRANLLSVFDNLLQTQAFTDVSLVAHNGQIIKCHKIVLAACSSYFQKLFESLQSFSQNTPFPIIILKDVNYEELQAILQYIYHGEVNVRQEQLKSLLNIAQMLQVKGLVQLGRNDSGEEEFSPHSADFSRHDNVMETSLSPSPAISTSTNANNMAVHSSDHVSPPHSTGGTYSGFYSKSSGMTSEINQIQNHVRFWPLSLQALHHGVSAGHELLSHSSSVSSLLSGSGNGGGDGGGNGGGNNGGGGSSYDNSFETTSPLKRVKKTSLLTNRDTPILRTVLGQGHVDSSVTGVSMLQSDNHESMHFHTSSNGSAKDNDNRRSNTDLAHSSYTDPHPSMDEDEKQQSPQSYTESTKSGNATHVQPKPEWKRYKQYTQNDIDSAIKAVKMGTSAVQAARLYGVPSRTLYDKVKKLGIPTSRPFKRSMSHSGSAACFPSGIGGNVNGKIYSDIYNIMSENENENSNTENLATSTSGASTFDIYSKSASKDVSQDRDYNSSPVIRCTKQKQQEQQQQQQQQNDEVEDLSVSRKSDVPVIMLTSSETIKDEPQETGSNNNDCDYS